MTVPTYTITSVVTPFTGSNDLTCLLNVKADLSLDGWKPVDDIYLTRQIAQASQSVRNYCNREFAQQTYQDLVRPQRDARPWFLPAKTSSYMVKNLPLVSVTSVTENGVLLTANVDYEVNLQSSSIYRLDSNGNPRQWDTYPLIIVYVAGFTLAPATSPTLPADLEDAVIRMIKGKWFDRNRDMRLKSQEIAGVGKEEYWISQNPDEGNMTPDVTDILDNYRPPTVA